MECTCLAPHSKSLHCFMLLDTSHHICQDDSIMSNGKTTSPSPGWSDLETAEPRREHSAQCKAHLFCSPFASLCFLLKATRSAKLNPSWAVMKFTEWVGPLLPLQSSSGAGEAYILGEPQTADANSAAQGPSVPCFWPKALSQRQTSFFAFSTSGDAKMLGRLGSCLTFVCPNVAGI